MGLSGSASKSRWLVAGLGGGLLLLGCLVYGTLPYWAPQWVIRHDPWFQSAFDAMAREHGGGQVLDYIGRQEDEGILHERLERDEFIGVVACLQQELRSEKDERVMLAMELTTERYWPELAPDVEALVVGQASVGIRMHGLRIMRRFDSDRALFLARREAGGRADDDLVLLVCVEVLSTSDQAEDWRILYEIAASEKHCGSDTALGLLTERAIARKLAPGKFWRWMRDRPMDLKPLVRFLRQLVQERGPEQHPFIEAMIVELWDRYPHPERKALLEFISPAARIRLLHTVEEELFRLD